MALPLKYNFRNVFVRWRTTAFTVAGIGAVVAVFVRFPPNSSPDATLVQVALAHTQHFLCLAW
jgi:hypothetical protein